MIAVSAQVLWGFYPCHIFIFNLENPFFSPLMFCLPIFACA